MGVSWIVLAFAVTYKAWTAGRIKGLFVIGETPDDDLVDEHSVPPATHEDYRAALKAFDAAVCEARAVSQAASGRMPAPHASYATYVFARLCSHATAIVQACPRSRWISSEWENWEFGSIAGHARAILETRLLFAYISKMPVSPDEWSAKLNVMHLHDCTRRIRLLRSTSGREGNEKNEQVAETLKDRLRANPWFCKLDPNLRKSLLSGEHLTITKQKQLIQDAGWTSKEYFLWYDFWSQYAHALPLSFYRMEPNGRGTGLENDTDRSYFTIALNICAKILEECIDQMVELFPDTVTHRKGLDSKFSPGPRRNLPRHLKRR